jgi:hypothetical protein
MLYTPSYLSARRGSVLLIYISSFRTATGELFVSRHNGILIRCVHNESENNSYNIIPTPFWKVPWVVAFQIVVLYV